MQEFEKVAVFAMMDQMEAQMQLITSQMRHIRGLMYHLGAERPQTTPAAKPTGGKHGSEEYLGEDDEAAIEKFIEDQRLLGLREAERVTKQWENQRRIIESEENTL